MDLGYARVSTTKQDLDRQIVALEAAGIPPERIYVDKKSGATTNRPGLQAVIEYARDGDVIVVHTLDRLGRTVRDTLNLIHDLAALAQGILMTVGLLDVRTVVVGGGVSRSLSLLGPLVREVLERQPPVRRDRPPRGQRPRR